LALADAYRRDGRYDQTRRIIASLQATHPDSKAVQLQTAQLLEAQGDLQAAEAIYAELAPDDLDASLALARLLADSNRPRDCVFHLSDAVDTLLYERRVDALVLRARCLIQSVQFEAAQADLETALRIQPQHVNARFHQTRVFALTGQFERAETALSELARDQRFSQTELHRLRAEIADIRGRFEVLGAGFGPSEI
jgi:thioredoxin-like negative regulator of GroEL